MANRRKTIKGIISAIFITPLVGFFNLKAKPMQDVPDQQFFELDKIYKDLKASGNSYNPFLRVPKLNSGLYVLPAGTEDKQSPHRLDEVYYVISGKAKFKSGGEQTEVKAGSIIYVKAEIDHRFFNIEEELKIMVFFSEMK